MMPHPHPSSEQHHAVRHPGAANARRAPAWLHPLAAMLALGQRPQHGWIALSLVGDLAPWVPSLDASSYRRGDDLSALNGLDVEIVANDQTGYGVLMCLANAALTAGPRLLGISIGGGCPTVVVLHKPRGTTP